MAGLTNRHRSEVQIAKYVTEVEIEMHRRGSELRRVAGQSCSPEIRTDGKPPPVLLDFSFGRGLRNGDVGSIGAARRGYGERKDGDCATGKPHDILTCVVAT